MISADIVTVYHNEDNYQLHLELLAALKQHERRSFRFIGVDNRTINRGFAAGCNLGAFHPEATAPVIGFLNPDVQIRGTFIEKAAAQLRRPVVITGCRYGKPQRELDVWGVNDWVCGATFFVERKWFQTVGGFDTQFVWSWEETDLIRQAQSQNLAVKSIELPIVHTSPETNTPEDSNYKRFHFEQGRRRFTQKWQRRSV